MKRTIYIILAGILGLLLGLTFHAVIETLVLRAGIRWDYWHPTYHIPFTIITSAGGLAFGIWLGKMWWQWIYVEKRHHGWFKR